MPFAKRDQLGQIIALYAEPRAEADERVNPNDEEVLNFLIKSVNEEGAKTYLEHTDTEMTRITEDIIDLLIRKKLILLTDLPKAAQDKLNLRKRLRSEYLGNDPLLLEDDII